MRSMFFIHFMNNHCLYSVFVIGAYVLRCKGCHISLHPRDHFEHPNDKQFVNAAKLVYATKSPVL